MKVLITGSNGFIGKNLTQHLIEKQDIEIITFDINDDFSKIVNNICDIDFIFHLAGINRPTDNTEFYNGNTNLTKSIINLISEKKLSIPFLITSSIQATNETDYGKSKKLAEDSVIEYSKNNPAYIFRLHNVFGKWCKPNYNSVVATFCYNTSNNIDLTINDENAQLNLIYIDDVIEEFIDILNNNIPSNKEDNYCYVNPIYNIKLGELATLIKTFKTSFTDILVPDTGDEFTKKLFSTYLSYVNLEDLVFSPKMNIDERGSFTELVKTSKSGQVSVSVSKPGVIRGNHYHHTKMEKFIVIKGSAKITFKHVITLETKEFYVDDNDFKIVNIPVGYTHNIENIGKEEMILLIWCNEIFDSSKPDTYFKEV